jgi:tetratricopeptide (TPR) repeat protein
VISDSAWRARVDALWGTADDSDQATREAFVAAMAALVAERAADDPEALYEHGSAYDAMGYEPDAEPLYRRALAAGLDGPLRRECVIQLASTLRNLDRADEGLALLDAEAAASSDELDDAVQAFRALALASLGREREATGVALAALAAHLPRFRRSVEAYARELSA